jgi:hypothetical protein
VAVKPVLGDWEIPRVDLMRTTEARKFAELAVPGRQGSLFQDLNAEPTSIEIGGSLFADEERSEFLDTVREKFRAGEPATFVADITQATDIAFVVIDSMRFEQRADHPDEVFYHLLLRESPPPPPPPDPLGGIDAGLLDQAAGFVDGVTGALDALEALANLPDFSDPTALLGGTLEKVTTALDGLSSVTTSITQLFGE